MKTCVDVPPVAAVRIWSGVLTYCIFGVLLAACRVPKSVEDNKQAAGGVNVVYILADDLGYGDLQCFNPNGKIPTPNIDRLAAEGMKFTDAHSSSAVCTPSRYSILTGRYPWRSTLQKGVLFGYSPPLVEPERLTVAELFKQQGYYTACVGKWHLGMDWPVKNGYTNIKTGWEIDYGQPIHQGPTTRGFDYYYGISASLDMPPYVFIENNKTMGIPSVTKQYGRSGPAAENFEAVNVLPAITRKAQQIITAQAGKKQPFFLYFALPSPHTPVVPGAAFAGKSGVTAYGDFVMETDWVVGQIMQTLDAAGITGNTIVYFTSDNGFAPYVLNKYNVEKMGHYPSYTFRGYKADIWEGGHRVPLVVRWPGAIPAGSVSNATVSLTDLMATSADMLQVKLPGNAAEDSYSLLPCFTGKATGPVRPAIVYASIDGNFSIQEGQWKLVFGPGSGGWAAPRNNKAYQQGLPLVQLYNMEADVSEKQNVAGERPEVVKRLTGLMEQYVANGRSTPGTPLQNNAAVDIWKKGYIKQTGK
ncbi:sulfatase family protein [Chitinophaga alhagiae]|uniref:sulfatase family protein n=1 Tax=Chitinophaga alhagiae TaxID=2203219 RepID=UPI001E5A7E55|nr:arylsulfatase [Chitinophaga alhagiae]